MPHATILFLRNEYVPRGVTFAFRGPLRRFLLVAPWGRAFIPRRSFNVAVGALGHVLGTHSAWPELVNYSGVVVELRGYTNIELAYSGSFTAMHLVYVVSYVYSRPG